MAGFLLLASGVFAGELEISGSLQNELTYTESNPCSKFGTTATRQASSGLANSIQLRLDLETKPDKDAKLEVKSLYDYDALINDGKFYLNRACLSLKIKELYLLVGKQSIVWGTGFAWNPTNYINPPKDPTKPKSSEIEEKGVTAIKAEMPVRAGNWTVVISPHQEAEEIEVAARFKTFFFDYDLSLSTCGGKHKKPIYGFACAGDIANIVGIHSEFSVKKGSSLHDGNNSYYKALIGGDYTISVEKRSIVKLEYFHQNEGFAKIDKYLAKAPNELLEIGEIGRNYLCLNLSYEFNDDFRNMVNLLWNLDDRSFALIPTAYYSVGDNIELGLEGNIGIGKGGSEFKSRAFKHQTSLKARMYF
ncbi:MAG: hypothetical protein ABIF11_07425 [Nitrospirota bacterium]